MPACVCALTGKGYGAIGSILLYGQNAESILSRVFVPRAAGAGSFEIGSMLHGRMIEKGQILDDVVVGCEGENRFVIHCHGNLLLVQKIIQLFIHGGAQLTHLENAVVPVFNTPLEKEAYFEQLRAVTVEGVKIIQSQISGGLSATVKGWLDNSVSMEEIQRQCREILKRSPIARRIIHGVKIVLAGPANSGKSTLLNTLAGSEKAIVSEIAGTTRDWVSTHIHIGPLRAEIIDTAGLGENALREAVDKSAQQKTLELINQCDGVLWIEDGSDRSAAGGEVDGRYPVPAIHLTAFGGCHPPVIEVLNKSDLSGGKLPENESDGIRISAKTGEGIDALLSEIQKHLLVCNFDDTLPVVFTGRQEKLLEAIAASGRHEEIREQLAQLAGSY
jgi:tRNA modification GTPase